MVLVFICVFFDFCGFIFVIGGCDVFCWSCADGLDCLVAFAVLLLALFIVWGFVVVFFVFSWFCCLFFFGFLWFVGEYVSLVVLMLFCVCFVWFGCLFVHV